MNSETLVNNIGSIQMKFTLWKSFILMLALLARTVAVNAEITDISCVYETAENNISDTEGHSHHHGDAKKPVKWFFWRTDKTVEVSNAEQSFGEKWTLSNQDTVFYQALYHDKKFLLDFQPADLKILGKKTNWELRSSLFSQKLLKQLEQKHSGKFKQYVMVHYQGKIAGTEYQIDWLPELNLPARVEKVSLGKKVVTELKEIYLLAQTPYKQLANEKYDDMEYADIGDNESHPVVAQLQKNTGVGYFHQH
jgi:hypothetical protein